MQFTADKSSNPVLNEVSVTFSPLPVGGEASAVMNPSIMAAWIMFCAAFIVGAGMVLRRRRIKA